MSSLFTASEVALAKLALDKLEKTQACLEKRRGGSEISVKWDVVVGGLGLGYTASAVLENMHVGSLLVVEFLQPVIDWHISGLVPLDPPLSMDARCALSQGDFFARVQSPEGFDLQNPGRKFDAILIDIDHSPDWHLHEQSARFYSEEGLRELGRHCKPGGVIGLWSDAGTDDAFLSRLKNIFHQAWAEPVTFHNPLQNKPFTQTVYLAQTTS